MSNPLLQLRYHNPVAFGLIMARARELASIQGSKGEKAETAERGQSQVDERLRLQMEWNRASAENSQNPDDLENWDFATLAMIAMFPSQPHPEI